MAVIDKKIIGFLAISNGKERILKFDKSKCTHGLGKVMGVITYHEMKFILGRPSLENETDIGIDYLATSEAYRGQGIASKLIEYDQHNSIINRMLGFGCISRMKKTCSLVNASE